MPRSRLFLFQLAVLVVGMVSTLAAAADEARVIRACKAAEKSGGMMLTLNTTGAWDFSSVQILLDTDASDQTGWSGVAGLGADLMVEGETLYRFEGNDRDAWSWKPAGKVDRTIREDELTLTLAPGVLPAGKVRLVARTLSADWKSVLSTWPKTGTMEVAIPEGAKSDATPSPTTAALRPPVAMAAPHANRNVPVRERIAKAKNFYCYYGKGCVEELSYYDVVILHSPEFAPANIKKLKELGVVTIGYITVGEDDQLRSGNGKGPGGYASWYFDRQQPGKPDRNGTWNSYFANAADPAWREDRATEARRLLEQDGYDGLFLDTLDTVENYKQSYDGMVQLVQEFRRQWPNAPIVLNQGYSLLPKLAPICDALMLESFTSTYDFSSKTYMLNYPGSLDFHLARMKRDVLPILAKSPMPVFVLDYALPTQRQNIQTAADRAASFGFLFAAAPIFLDDVYADMPVGKPDPKWLQKVATPEAMSLKLDKSANGFAPGTRVVPSGCFAGYTVAPLVDGVKDRSNLHWSKAAWASAEDGEAPWLEIRLPALRKGGRLLVDFYQTPDARYISRDIRVAVLGEDGTWRPAETSLTQLRLAAKLPEKDYHTIRISQTALGGSAERPNLMWLSQISLEP